MGNLSDPGRSRGDLTHRIVEIERRLRSLETARRLPAASIGSGGLRVIGGAITVDDGEIRIRGGRLIAGDAEGARAEITPTGYQLINEDGEVDIDLTTQGANEILLRGSGDEDNEILLSQDGQINGRVLNVEQIILDGQDLSDLLAGNDITDPDPSPGDQTDVYTAVWSRAYRQNGQPNEFVPGGGLTQGFYSGTNGNQRSLIGFNTGQIQSDLAGRTVTRVRVRLRFYHWYNNSGGTAILGHHSHSSPPGSFSATATDVVRSPGWPKPGTRWVTYNHSMQQWATGAKAGIVLGPGPTTSRLYYGAARAHNQSSPPLLEIKSTA